MYRVIAAIFCVAAMFGAQQTITMPFGQAAEIHGQLKVLRTPVQKATFTVVNDYQSRKTSRAFLVADQH